ncbi:hypothetical protein BC831DRAFT_481456 [Entophlyctis helioformis]|nr:hypothetical protein BC831DRAFT_481456 [Entophlyctis helioformis]
MTHGEWDLRYQISREAREKSIALPPYFGIFFDTIQESIKYLRLLPQHVPVATLAAIPDASMPPGSVAPLPPFHPSHGSGSQYHSGHQQPMPIAPHLQTHGQYLFHQQQLMTLKKSLSGLCGILGVPCSPKIRGASETAMQVAQVALFLLERAPVALGQFRATYGLTIGSQQYRYLLRSRLGPSAVPASSVEAAHGPGSEDTQDDLSAIPLVHPVNLAKQMAMFLESRSCTVRLSGLPFRVTEHEVEEWLSTSNAKLVRLVLSRNRQQRLDGTGFAVFANHDDARLCLILNGRTFMDRTIQVSPCQDDVLDAAPLPHSLSSTRPSTPANAALATTVPSTPTYASTTRSNIPSFRDTKQLHALPPNPRPVASLHHLGGSSTAAIVSAASSPSGRRESGSARATAEPNKPSKSAEWECPTCQFSNFAERKVCLNCTKRQSRGKLHPKTTMAPDVATTKPVPASSGHAGLSSTPKSHRRDQRLRSKSPTKALSSKSHAQKHHDEEQSQQSQPQSQQIEQQQPLVPPASTIIPTLVPLSLHLPVSISVHASQHAQVSPAAPFYSTALVQAQPAPWNPAIGSPDFIPPGSVMLPVNHGYPPPYQYPSPHPLLLQSMPATMPPTPHATRFRDWICPVKTCQFVNYGSRATCMRCQLAKPVHFPLFYPSRDQPHGQPQEHPQQQQQQQPGSVDPAGTPLPVPPAADPVSASSAEAAPDADQEPAGKPETPTSAPPAGFLYPQQTVHEQQHYAFPYPQGQQPQPMYEHYLQQQQQQQQHQPYPYQYLPQHQQQHFVPYQQHLHQHQQMYVAVTGPAGMMPPLPLYHHPYTAPMLPNVMHLHPYPGLQQQPYPPPYLQPVQTSEAQPGQHLQPAGNATTTTATTQDKRHVQEQDSDASDDTSDEDDDEEDDVVIVLEPAHRQ